MNSARRLDAVLPWLIGLNDALAFVLEARYLQQSGLVRPGDHPMGFRPSGMPKMTVG